MLKIKRLPDAELEIMNALWDADVNVDFWDAFGAPMLCHT